MPERFKRPDPRAVKKEKYSKSPVKQAFARTWDFGTGVGTVLTPTEIPLQETSPQEQAVVVKDAD